MVTTVSVTTPTRTTTSTSSTTSTTASDASSASLNYDSFLTLFMTELQNQDPTSPMDTTEQMSQLASFSQVEQQIKTNTNLTNLISQNYITQAGSLIGKTATDSEGTTGVISSIKIGDSALTATLASGKTITLGSGVTISSGS
jgi:flagellar basal-body rod modification protein FlgD